MKILHIDIETAPNVCYTWGLFNQNIGINQIVEPGYTLCYAAKWDHSKEIMFDAEWLSGMGNMLKSVHKLLTEADVVVHYNGRKFDIPTLSREFIKYDMPPPNPFQQVDLYSTVRNRFKFASNKLDWVCQELGLGNKVHHRGMSLWNDCMEGNKKAQREMERYNKQDVRLLPKLYKRLLPWIKNHPNYGLFGTHSDIICTNCGSTHVQARGMSRTATQMYQRYQCQGCGTWLKGRKTELDPSERENILVQDRT